jgi:hypothetical protein
MFLMQLFLITNKIRLTKNKNLLKWNKITFNLIQTKFKCFSSISISKKILNYFKDNVVFVLNKNIHIITNQIDYFNYPI